jgi:hypothetical protein
LGTARASGSTVAHKGRAMSSKDEHDKLEPNRNGDAAPEHIAPETTSPTGISTDGKAEGDLHFDRGDPGAADTDRHEFRTGRDGELRICKDPTSLSFGLTPIKSLNAKCFFCKELECDLVFMAKSRVPSRTRAYAVHSECVFDHEDLQALGSRGGT